MPEPADRPPSLRDQIAQAMRDANGTPEALAAWQRHPQLVPVDVYADAVMHAIEAHIVLAHVDATQRADLLAGRLEQAERERDTAREALNAAAIVITSLRDQRDEQRQRTENAEMEGRNILRRLDIADRLAGALEDERDKARRERDEERVIRQQAEEIIAIAHDTSNQAERARQAAERALAQARDAIADERRGRLAAEAAVRRGREIHRRHDCARHVSAHTPVPCVNEGLCDGCAARYPCQTATALEAEQPKETP